MLTVESEQTEESIKNAELFMEGIQILIREFGERLRTEEMADLFLAVGYDIIHHIAQHSMPGAEREDIVGAVENYNEIMMDKLKKEVWNGSSDDR